MARRKYTPEEIITNLREIEVRLSQGESAAHAARAVGITEPTYYRWRREYGGLKTSQAISAFHRRQYNGYIKNGCAIGVSSL